MNLLSKTHEQRARKTVGEFDKLRAEMREVLGILNGHEDNHAVLKRKLVDKQIEFDREHEKWEREKREVEHMVGLQKKRAEQERELAVKAAQLEVREANMEAKEDAFEERLEKVTEQLSEQINYLRTDIIKSILERLPTFEVKTALEPHKLLAAGNGKDAEED